MSRTRPTARPAFWYQNPTAEILCFEGGALTPRDPLPLPVDLLPINHLPVDPLTPRTYSLVFFPSWIFPIQWEYLFQKGGSMKIDFRGLIDFHYVYKINLAVSRPIR